MRQLELFPIEQESQPKVALSQTEGSVQPEKKKVASGEIQKLKKILTLPKEKLSELGITEETLFAIRENLKQIQSEALKIEQFEKENKIYSFSPNPPQLDFWINFLNPKFKTFAYTGGNRRGKTTIGCHLAIVYMIGFIPYKLECKDNEGVIKKTWDSVYEEIKEFEGKTWKLIWKDGIPLVELIYPTTKFDYKTIRYIGQGWQDHVKDVVVIALKKWWPKDIPIKVTKNGDGIEVYWVEPKTGNYLRLMSNDQPARKFAGKDDDLVILDEPPKLDNYIELRRGTLERKGKVFLGATLLAEEIWVDRQIIKAKMKDGSPDPRIYHSTGEMSDNLGFGITDQEDIDDFADELKRLKPQDYDARIKGKPSYLAGVIYSTFTVLGHVKKKFSVPLEWIVDIAIDPHPRTEHAVLFLATAPNGLKWVVDEIWSHADPKSLAEMILRKIKLNCYRVENPWLIDPHSKGDSNNPETTYEKIENVILPHRYSLEPAEKGQDCIDDGIIVVKDWLMTQNNMPALFFFDSVVQTIWEIEGWMWNPKTGKPFDKDDHMMENLRRLISLGTVWKAKRKKVTEVTSSNWRLT